MNKVAYSQKWRFFLLFFKKNYIYCCGDAHMVECSLLGVREVQAEEAGTGDFAKVCGPNGPLEAPPP